MDTAVDGLAEHADIELLTLDMTSFQSIRAAAAKLNEEAKPIDVGIVYIAIHSFPVH